MTRPRNELVSVQDARFYHVVSRCVRRAYLCGSDKVTGKSFEHRRQWIEERIRLLSSLFGIEICAYSVMQNHLHIVVKLCPEEISSLKDAEIVERWTSIFKGPPVILRWIKEGATDSAKLEKIRTWIESLRERLSSLSWFMKCLNEPIARQANKEDGCKGHFWESRFKFQALITEEAILTCMAYVDLNPIRAQIADTPETSNYTSIKERIDPSINKQKAIQSQLDHHALQQFRLPLKPLAKLEGSIRQEIQTGVLFSFEDYLQLVDYTGRITNPKKRGVIPLSVPPILKRLDIDLEEWVENTQRFEKIYQSRFSHRCVHFENTG